MPELVAEADMEMSWTQLPPGPELGIRLAMVDWEALSDRELAAALEASRRQTSYTQSLQLCAVQEMADRRYAKEGTGDSETHRRIAGDVSLQLTVTTGQAEELVWLAEVLPQRLPATWAALRFGQIDYDRAKVMADGLAAVDDELSRRLDAELIGEAVECTRTQLRRKLTSAVRAADPQAVQERARRAKDERRVELWDNPESDTCDLVGRNMSAADAYAIRNRLTAAAQAMKADGDSRTVDQIRADLHRDLLRGIPLPDAVRHLLTADDDPSGQPTGPTAGPDAEPAVDVIAAAERVIAEALGEIVDEQLTEVFDRARAHGRIDGLAGLVGDAVQAMREAIAGTVDAWCRATSQTSRADGHGHPGYRPPAAMQRLIQHRHSVCVFPTCNRRSIHCDLDHTVPFDKGGRTCK
jgi:hypothetical protein